MKKFKEYTREKWEDIGLLSSTPEDRKDKVAHALNVAVKFPGVKEEQLNLTFVSLLSEFILIQTGSMQQ